MRTTAICVPVRDEEALLPRLLEALCAIDRPGDDIVACFHLDGCRDDSEAVIRSFAQRLAMPVAIGSGVRSDAPNAGRARAAAAAGGLAQLDGDGMLLFTDADSWPRRDWLTRALAALRLADVVAGRIVTDGLTPDSGAYRVGRYYDRLHALRRRIDPVPWDAGDTHCGGGANMACHASAYRRLGGFAPLPAGEDAAFLDEAHRAGLRVRRDASVVVDTSARRVGRATGGLASALDQIDREGLPAVPPPSAALWQYRGHAAARRAFARIDAHGVASALGVAIDREPAALLALARDCANAEAFAIRAVPAGPGHDRTEPLDRAEAALAAFEEDAARIAA